MTKIYFVGALFIITLNSLPLVKCSGQLNVVLVISDDLRPVISGYGDRHAKTPNIDRFMSISTTFTRAYCQQALCAPSRNSFLTGRRPDTLHLYDFYNYWRAFTGNFTTLPQFFKDNGYHTYSIGKVFHPGTSSNFTDDYPLSWSKRVFHPSSEKYENTPVCPDGTGINKENINCPVRLSHQPERTLPDIQSIDEAGRFLNARKNNSQPYFLAIGLYKPHIPFRYPEKFLKLHPRKNFIDKGCVKPNDLPHVAWNPYADIRHRNDAYAQNIPFPYGPIPKKFRTSLRQSYYASVSYVDHLFGKLLTAIDLKNTILIFTSDHGWSLGEHGEWAKYSNFEVAVRVPLIIYSPEIKNSAPKMIETVVELVDLFPTIVDLAHLPAIPSCKTPNSELLCSEGKSLYGLLQNKTFFSYSEALSQYPRPNYYPMPNSDRPKLSQIHIMGYSLRTNSFRYTVWIKFYHQNFTRDWEQVYGEELYDHRIDPNESINLSHRTGFEDLRKWFLYRIKQKVA